MAATQKKKQQEAPAPQIEARIDRMVDGDYKTKAYASVTIAGAFAVHGLRVIETDKGRFISMPQESYKKAGFFSWPPVMSRDRDTRDPYSSSVSSVMTTAPSMTWMCRSLPRSPASPNASRGTGIVISATVRKEVTELGAIHRG